MVPIPQLIFVTGLPDVEKRPIGSMCSPAHHGQPDELMLDNSVSGRVGVLGFSCGLVGKAERLGIGGKVHTRGTFGYLVGSVASDSLRGCSIA